MEYECRLKMKMDETINRIKNKMTAATAAANTALKLTSLLSAFTIVEIQKG